MGDEILEHRTNIEFLTKLETNGTRSLWRRNSEYITHVLCGLSNFKVEGNILQATTIRTVWQLEPIHMLK